MGAVVAEGKTVGGIVSMIPQKVIESASAIKNKTDGLYPALQFANYACMGIEHFCGRAKPLTLVMPQISGGINIIDFADVATNVDYFINGDVVEDVKKGLICKVLGSLAMSVAAVAGAVLWLAEMGVLNIARIANAIASSPAVGAAFNAVRVVGLSVLAGFAATVGYVFLVGDALQSIVTAKNRQQCFKGILDLISRIGNVALHIFLLIPVANVPAIVTLGLIAKGVEVISFLYQYHNRNAINV